MSSRVSTKEILTGRILPVMLRLGWPIMLSAILDTSYQLVDTLWLGRLPGSEGGNAVAGLQISFTIIWFSFAFVIGFAMAGTALVSQYTGASFKKDADFSAGQVLSIAGISGIIISAVGIPLMPRITPLITNIKSLSDAASLYISIYLIGLPFQFITGVSRALLSASGNTITPMKISAVTNIINLLIDPVLIFGIGPFPALGIAGAASASAVSMFISAFVSLWIIFKGREGIRIKWNYLIPRFEWIRKTLRIGFPASIANCAESLGFIFLLTLIGWIPEAREALGGFGVGMRINNTAFFIISGLGQGLTVIIGQRLGAGNLKKAEYAARYGIFCMFLVLFVEMSIIIFFRKSLMWLFVPKEPDMIIEGSKFILFVGMSLPFFGIAQGIYSAFHAAGKNVPTAIISFCRLWIFRLPLCYFLGITLGYSSNGVWTAMGISNILTSLLSVGFFVRGKWKTNIFEKTDV